MRFWKEKWSEMSWYRRILLAAMAVMILAFGAATPVIRSAQGIAYGGTLLRFREEGEVRRYEGTVDGASASFAVHPDGTVEYRWGDFVYGPYQVILDPSAAPEAFGSSMTGFEIRRGEELLFRGGALPSGQLLLYGEDGEPVLELEIRVYTDGGTVMGENGRVITQEEDHQPSLSTLARVALWPELIHRGSVGLYLLTTLLALFNILQICFPGFFFRLSLLGHVRNWEEAEPSEFYIAMEKLEWLVLAGVCLFCYHGAANVIA